MADRDQLHQVAVLVLDYFPLCLCCGIVIWAEV